MRAQGQLSDDICGSYYTRSALYCGNLSFCLRRSLNLRHVCAQYGTIACVDCAAERPADCTMNCASCELLGCPCLTLIIC